MSALCSPEALVAVPEGDSRGGTSTLPHLELGTSRGLVSTFFPALINTRLVSLAGREKKRKSPQWFAAPELGEERKQPKQSNHLSFLKTPIYLETRLGNRHFSGP